MQEFALLGLRSAGLALAMAGNIEADKPDLSSADRCVPTRRYINKA